MSDQEHDGDRGAGEIILYTAEGGAQVQLRAVDGTVWLTQAQLAEQLDLLSDRTDRRTAT